MNRISRSLLPCALRNYSEGGLWVLVWPHAEALDHAGYLASGSITKVTLSAIPPSMPRTPPYAFATLPSWSLMNLKPAPLGLGEPGKRGRIVPADPPHDLHPPHLPELAPPLSGERSRLPRASRREGLREEVKHYPLPPPQIAQPYPGSIMRDRLEVRSKLPPSLTIASLPACE